MTYLNGHSAINADYVTGDLRVWHERALFRRKAFRELISLSLFFDFPAELVGGDVQLLAFDLLFHKPGKGGIHWHRDVTFLCNKTVSMNMGMLLQHQSLKSKIRCDLFL